MPFNLLHRLSPHFAGMPYEQPKAASEKQAKVLKNAAVKGFVERQECWT
jgi:hypothetical protein